MVALSSASGCGMRIQVENCSFHSASVKHHCGLLAMILPLHSGKPQRSRSRLTSRAKVQETPLHPRRPLGGIGRHEDDAVILVGAEGLLVAPFGTKGQPGPFDAVEIVLFQIELDDAAGQRIVQRRNELGQLFGTNALGQHVESQLADIGSGLQQGIDVVGAVDGLANLAQADALQREQVALRNDTGQLAFGIGDQHVADAVGGHGNMAS
jgi:hypothetical protein